MHKMMIIVIKRNIDTVSGFPDIVLGDIYYNFDKFIIFKYFLQKDCPLFLKKWSLPLFKETSSKNSLIGVNVL